MTLVSNVSRFVDRKLAIYGRHFDVIRSDSASAPMANKVGCTLGYPYRNPKGHGNADWLLMLNDEIARPGDYLVAGDETYIFALKPLLLPAQAIRCTQSIGLLRPLQGQANGVQAYGGNCYSDGAGARTWPR